ncbi:expressed protein [Echinococcus multilocularis]|uniref:Expressed protein n=1 Tax=Echinococcus multilocularis TaxID=6211 RepID=A0A068YFP4_ECHMU|nr:expressed protein [Echinococcus multilocularis]
MSVQDSASALVDLFYCIGLPRYKADILRHFKLNSDSVYEHSLRMLYLFLQYVKYGQLQPAMDAHINKKSIKCVVFINEFLISRLSPLRICHVNETNASLNLLLLTWCLTDSNITYMPERFFREVLIGFPEENIAEVQALCQPIMKLKGCLFNISQILSAISIKESGLHLLFKTLMNQPHRSFGERFSQLNIQIQRNITLLELVYILDNHKYSKTATVRRFRQFLDLLSKWNRNSAAFYRWVRLPSENVCKNTSNSHFLNNGKQLGDDLINSYGGLESFQSTLLRCTPNPEAVEVVPLNKNNLILQEEFKRRLDYVSDHLQATLYPIFPMATYSVVSENSSSPLCFDSKTEKQILQSLVSSLNSLYHIKRERIHSHLIDSCRYIIPSVSCAHKSALT